MYEVFMKSQHSQLFLLSQPTYGKYIEVQKGCETCENIKW
jgi:hypothetical protein